MIFFTPQITPYVVLKRFVRVECVCVCVFKGGDYFSWLRTDYQFVILKRERQNSDNICKGNKPEQRRAHTLKLVSKYMHSQKHFVWIAVCSRLSVETVSQDVCRYFDFGLRAQKLTTKRERLPNKKGIQFMNLYKSGGTEFQNLLLNYKTNQNAVFDKI